MEKQLRRIDKIPDMPMCHVCGRNVCTESYEFHLSKCRDLWTYEVRTSINIYVNRNQTLDK